VGKVCCDVGVQKGNHEGEQVVKKVESEEKATDASWPRDPEHVINRCVDQNTKRSVFENSRGTKILRGVGERGGGKFSVGLRIAKKGE